VVEQGFEMGRPSLLEVEVDKRDGAVTASRVGGSSVLVTKGELFT
jgi:trans-2,3-dihydro-3-hydroxyanthranilate isomerase